jgi:small subunit ribosomal protein S33
MRAGSIAGFITQIRLATGVLNSGNFNLLRNTRSLASHPFEEESLEEIRARIFGNRIGNGLRSGAKLLKKKLVGEKIANYYPKPIAKNDPMFINLRAERCGFGDMFDGSDLGAEFVILQCMPNKDAITRLCVCSQKAKLEKLKRRGKGPPPKGQGKRAAKAKKK